MFTLETAHFSSVLEIQRHRGGKKKQQGKEQERKKEEGEQKEEEERRMRGRIKEDEEFSSPNLLTVGVENRSGNQKSFNKNLLK